MTDKVTHLELHFNYQNRFLRGYDRVEGHKDFYLSDIIKTKSKKLLSGNEIYNVLFINEKWQKCSRGILNPTFGRFFNSKILNILAPYYLYLDFDLLNQFKNIPNISGKIKISLVNDAFLMACEFVTLDPIPLKRTDINFIFTNNTCFKRAIDKISLISEHMSKG